MDPLELTDVDGDTLQAVDGRPLASGRLYISVCEGAESAGVRLDRKDAAALHEWLTAWIARADD
jgi:hypothetical protein